MDGLLLTQELDSELAKAEACKEEMVPLGRELAKAEREYRVALSKALLQGKQEGIPATILPDVCRGLDGVAALRMERDCAQVLVDANTSAYNLHKKKVDALRDQIRMGWWSPDA